MNLKDLKVVFAGCAKNCEKFLPKILQNLKDYSSLFQQTFTVIVENGSLDKTKIILKNSENDDCIVHFRDDFNFINIRTNRIAQARNLILDEIKSNQNLRDFDLLIMMDLDDRGIFKVADNNWYDAIKFLFSNDKIAGVFGNQPGKYYDMWALKDRLNYKGDFFGNALKFATTKMRSTDKLTNRVLLDLKTNYFDKKAISFPENSKPIKVLSAFGGLGIYKIEKIKENKRLYEGEQEINIKFKDGIEKKILYQKCDCVNFNEGFDDLNLDLFILPYLINSEKVEFEFITEVAFSLIINKKKLDMFNF